MFSSRQSRPRKRGGPALDPGAFSSGSASGPEDSLDRSMLDLVRTSANDLRSRVSAADQRSLDQYLDTLRTLETRVSAIDAQQAEAARAKSEQKAGKGGFTASPPIEVAIPTRTLAWGEHTRLMGDLMILAFQTDLTRVCSMIPSFKPDGRYEEIGIHQQHHDITHLENGPEKTEKLGKIDRFNLELFGYIITRMKGLKEGGGTLLDNCANDVGLRHGWSERQRALRTREEPAPDHHRRPWRRDDKDGTLCGEERRQYRRPPDGDSRSRRREARQAVRMRNQDAADPVIRPAASQVMVMISPHGAIAHGKG